MSTTSVDSVAKDSDLEQAVGGPDALGRIVPKSWTSAQPKRQEILDRVLRRLKQQVPPVLEADLTDVSELQDVVVYGSLMDLYQAQVTEQGDVFDTQAKHWRRMYEAELNGLRPTVAVGQVASPMSIAIHRR